MADLQAQFDLMADIRDRASEAADALIRLREARDRLDGLGAERADRIRPQLREIEGQLTRLFGSHSMDLEPKGLINKLGRLSSSVVAADARPTTQMYAVFEDLSARIAEQLNRLEQIMEEEELIS